MIQPGDVRRRLLPRWRGTDDAIAPTRIATHPEPVRSDVVEREQAWNDDRTSRGLALDLLSAAATTQAPTLTSVEAARWLRDELGSEISDIARSVATAVLAPPASQRQLDVLDSPDPADLDSIHARIRQLRRGLQEDPRNALGWSEQARMYTLVGQHAPAVRAMEHATRAAPDHRFVLRAAARLAVHLDESERAQALLLSSARTRSDPWLMASEIAIASLTGRGSRLAKSARELLARRNWTPRDLTELAGAMGTLELEAGSDNRARDHFRLSLQDPNDNSLAQAEWAAPQVSGVASRLAPAREATPRSFEADSRAAATAANHAKAVKEAWLWLLDQPFSTAPAQFGSYHAAVLQDFDRALEFARRGLQANPGDTTLLNNAAFALAKADRPAEASTYIMRIKPIESLHASDRSAMLATQGLIAFRSNKPAVGKALYLQAIDATDVPMTKALALIMLASELKRTRPPDLDEVLRSATEQGEGHLPKQDRAWLDYLRDTRRS